MRHRLMCVWVDACACLGLGAAELQCRGVAVSVTAHLTCRHHFFQTKTVPSAGAPWAGCVAQKAQQEGA
eukprot:4059866-Prymnesium_polylepis.1